MVDDESSHLSIDEGKVVKKGLLNKKGRKKIFRPWAFRTVVIDNQDHLYYYDGSVLKGEILLKDVKVRHILPEKADGKRFAFEIFNIPMDSPLRCDSLILASASEADAADWVDTITSIVHRKNTAKTNFEYESFEAVSKKSNTAGLNLKKIKQQRLQQMKEKEMAEDDEDDDDSDYTNENTAANQSVENNMTGKTSTS